MTINDLPLNEHCLKVRQLAELLPYHMRNGDASGLGLVIDSILEAATKAGYRLNDLRFTKGPQ